MKQPKLFGLCLLPLLCIAVAVGVPQAREGDVYRLLSDSSLRQGPDNIYAPSSSAVKGAQAIELNSSGEWTKVRMFSNGDVGWLYSSSLVLVAVNVEDLDVLESKLNISGVEETPAVVVIDDPLPLVKNKRHSPSQSVDVHPLDETDVSSSESQPVVQNMAPSKDSVDGETVSPIFEDGAVSLESVTLDKQASADKVESRVALDVESTLLSPVSTEIVEKNQGVLQKKTNLSIASEVTLDAASSAPVEPREEVNVFEQRAVEQFPVQLVNRNSDDDIQTTQKETMFESVQNDVSDSDNQTIHAVKSIDSNQLDETADGSEPVVDLRQFNKKATLRAGPGRTFDTVSWAGVGSKANELERRGSWVRLQMQVSKRLGWVHESSLDALLVKKVAEPELEIATNALDKYVSSTTIPPVSSSKAVAQKNVAAEKVAEIEPLESNISSPAASPDTDAKTIALEPVAHDTKPLASASSKTGSQLVMQTAVIRLGPSALSEVLGWAGAGAQVEAIHQQGKWMKVRLLDSDRIGWIEAASLDGASASSASNSMLHLPKKQIQHRSSVQTDAIGLTQPVLMEADNLTDTPVSDVLIQPKNEILREKSTQKSVPQWEIGSHAAEPVAVEVEPVADRLKAESSLYEFNKNTSIRAGPGATFDAVSWAGSGSQAIELDRQGDWVRIQMQLSKKIGWVYDRSLELISVAATVATTTATAAPIVKPVIDLSSPLQSAEQQVSTVEPVAEVNPDDVAIETKGDQISVINNLYSFNRKANLRSGPAIKYDVVSWAGQGAFAIEQMRQGDWVRVQMQANKRIGWVYKDSLELVSATATAIPVNMMSNADSAPKSNNETAGLSDHGLYFFKHTSNLRAGPGKKYDRIGWGGRNESAEELERQGDWQRIRLTMSGETGWVFSSYLLRAVHTGHIMGVSRRSVLSRSLLSQATKIRAKSGDMYEVTRTEPLRAEAEDFADLIGSVQKGDVVAWLEERNGWVRINSQTHGSKIGWLDGKLLKQQSQLQRKVEHNNVLISNDNLAAYKERISKGETFNFSYAALEEALYKIPVEDIHIRIGKEDLKALFLKRQYDQSPFEIRLTTGRHRLKGTVKVLGSSTRIFKKKSLLIKLDKQSERWYGHRRIALRSMASDKALMREWMAWKMMAALGMKVPEVHFTRVSFNRGEKTALYLSIEWMGKEFLEGNDLDVRGEFYQPNDAAHCGDLYSTEQLNLCFDKITPQNGDYSSLATMAKAVNAASNENIDQVLGQYFEDESIVNWIAVNALVTNGDTYNKNYWLYYHPTREKWTVVPWDYNLTYGRTYDQYSTQSFRIFNDNFQYFYPPDVGAGNPIKDKALRNPVLRGRLENKIKHLIGMEANGSEHTFGWFSPTVMHARIGNLAAVVGKEVYKDTFLSYGEGDFTKTYESLMDYVTAHDHFLKVKMFGDFPWEPEPPNQPFTFMRLPEMLIAEGEIKAGAESLYMVDRSWGYFVANLHLNEPLKSRTKFEVNIEGGIAPKYLPVAQSAKRCIERSWLLHTKTKNVSVTGDLRVEYIQENSRRSEVPPNIHEELLELWMFDGHRWKPVQTEVNEYSNILTGKNIDVRSGHKYRFVACSPF